MTFLRNVHLCDVWLFCSCDLLIKGFLNQFEFNVQKKKNVLILWWKVGDVLVPWPVFVNLTCPYIIRCYCQTSSVSDLYYSQDGVFGHEVTWISWNLGKAGSLGNDRWLEARFFLYRELSTWLLWLCITETKFRLRILLSLILKN